MIYIKEHDGACLDDHGMGVQLLSYVLQMEEGIRYQDEDIAYNPWGKPSMKNHPNVFYNISHSANHVACITSKSHYVGIDVEEIRDFSKRALKRVCSLKEIEAISKSQDKSREFFRYWTLKESYIKAIGMGLSYPMKEANFIIKSINKIETNLRDCDFLLLEGQGYVTAVCYKKL